MDDELLDELAIDDCFNLDRRGVPISRVHVEGRATKQKNESEIGIGGGRRGYDDIQLVLASRTVKQRLLLRGGLDHLDCRDRTVLMHHVRGHRPVDEFLARLAQGV